MKEPFEVNCYSYRRCSGFLLDTALCEQQSYGTDWAQQYTSTPQHRLLFITEGAARYGVNGQESEVEEYDLLIVPPGTAFSLQAVSEELDFLIIVFDLYVSMEFMGSLTERKSSGLRLSYEPAVIRTKPVTKIVNCGHQHLILLRIMNELEFQQGSYMSIVKNLLIELLINLFRMGDNTLSILEHIDCTSIWSGPGNEFPMAADTTLWVSDMEFWSDMPPDDDSGPAAENTAQLLGTVRAANYYIEEERSNGAVQYGMDDTQLYNGAPTGKLAVTSKTNYKLWFWPNKGVADMNLQPFINTGVVRFAVRSNQLTRFLFCLYKRSTYSCVSDMVGVHRKNAWCIITFPISASSGKRVSSVYVDNALLYIRENYMRKIQLSELAAFVHLQPTYLCTLFKQYMKMTIGDYIRYYRINVAKNLLLETSCKLEDIAISTGFYDVHHFCREFKEVGGLTPSAFRKNNGASHYIESKKIKRKAAEGKGRDGGIPAPARQSSPPF